MEKVVLNRKSNMPDMTFQKNWQQKSLETERQQLKGLEKDKDNDYSLALLESRQHALKLERAIELLQNRIDELISEKTKISEESIELNDALENSNAHSQLLEHKLSIEIHQKSELEQEINALYKQFDVLKNFVESHKEALLAQQKATEDAHIALKNEQEQNLDIKASISAYKEEIERVRQHLSHGLQDAKKVENRLAEAVSERAETQRMLQQQRREYDKQQLELLDIKERLGAYIAREKRDRYAFDEKISHLNTIQAATETKLKLSLFQNEQLLERLDLAQIQNDLHESQFSQLEEIKAQFDNAQSTHQEEISLLEEQLQQASQEIALLHNANDQLQQEIIAVTVLNEDKQLQLDEAQHHLAKKVRESALQNEKIEEFLLREIETENVHEALHHANTLLQNDLHTKEKKIKEYIDKVSSQDKEILRWEEKWRETNQSRQILEEKIQDLEKIEQRHTQLQNILLGFGAGSLTTASTNQPSHPPQENENKTEQNIRRHPRLQFGVPVEEEAKIEVAEEESLGNASAYPNLFDIPQMKMPPKQNLFD